MDLEKPPYHRLSDADLSALLQDFESGIEDFIHYVLGYPKGISYTVCGLDLIDTIIRVDKRQHYFRIFHNMEINDCKKASLFAYWIVKFRPIKITDPKYRNLVGYNDTVNELYAIDYLLSALVGVGKIKLWDGKEGVKISLDNPYIQELRYSLRFRSFTIDSMIVLGDSISTETFNLPPNSPV